MSAIEGRKHFGLTNCRIQQISKARRIMFWQGNLLRMGKNHVVKITKQEMDEARSCPKMRWHYIYACGHKCYTYPPRRHNRQCVGDALEKVRKRNEEKYKAFYKCKIEFKKHSSDRVLFD